MSNVTTKLNIALLVFYVCSAFASGDGPSDSGPQPNTGNSRHEHGNPLPAPQDSKGEVTSEDTPSQLSPSSVDKQMNSKHGQKGNPRDLVDIDSPADSPDDVNKQSRTPMSDNTEGRSAPVGGSDAQTEALQSTEDSTSLPDDQPNDVSLEESHNFEPLQQPSSDDSFQDTSQYEAVDNEPGALTPNDDAGGSKSERLSEAERPTLPSQVPDGATETDLEGPTSPSSDQAAGDREGGTHSEETLNVQQANLAEPTTTPPAVADSDEGEYETEGLTSETVPTIDQANELLPPSPTGEDGSELVGEPPVSPPPTEAAAVQGPPLTNTKSHIHTEGVLGETPSGTEMGEEEEEEEEEEGAEEDIEDDEPADDLFKEGTDLIGKADINSKKRGYEVMMKAASDGNSKAKETLGYGYLFGNVLERNFTTAFKLFSELAADGHPAGQQGLGFMYSNGIGVNSSQAKAVLHYTFAALGGHRYAQMAMGYRALMGISVVQSCEGALSYYYKAATKVVKESSPITGGHGISKVRLLDEEDEESNNYDEMVQYHSVFADSGNKGTQLLLGVLYMYGMGGAERSFKMALRFFNQAADEGLPDAYAYIGKIYAEGSDEVPKDYAKALEYFEKAADQKHPDGFNGLGLIYFYGMGVEVNYKTAQGFFQKGAERGSTDAQYYLGHMHLNGYGVPRDAGSALKYFQLASHGGHLLAIYSLGKMHAEGTAVKRNCNYAVELLKVIAERGKWTQMFQEAEKLYNNGDLDSSLIMYLLFAEFGVEVAQANAAYLLEQEDITLVDKNETLKRALVLWNRAAIQGYSEARVKLGDYYYYGLGTSVNYEAAASQYRIASDKLSSPQAMFNLGYMYEQGLGLVKDYHLAKRYYDMAAETSAEAIIPVNLALFKMNLVSFYGEYYKYLSGAEVAVVVGHIEAVFGKYWDYYLITVLAGLVVMLLMWRRR